MSPLSNTKYSIVMIPKAYDYDGVNDDNRRNLAYHEQHLLLHVQIW